MDTLAKVRHTRSICRNVGYIHVNNVRFSPSLHTRLHIGSLCLRFGINLMVLEIVSGGTNNATTPKKYDRKKVWRTVFRLIRLQVLLARVVSLSNQTQSFIPLSWSCFLIIAFISIVVRRLCRQRAIGSYTSKRHISFPRSGIRCSCSFQLSMGYCRILSITTITHDQFNYSTSCDARWACLLDPTKIK